MGFSNIIDWKIEDIGNGGSTIDEPNANNIINRIIFRYMLCVWASNIY
jgi:hypothetical protein